MIRARLRALVAAGLAASCASNFDPSILERPIGPDTGVVGDVSDDASAPVDITLVDDGAPPDDVLVPDVPAPPPDVPAPPPDVPAPPPDVPAPPPDVPAPPPDVPAPPPDVPRPPDVPSMCRACSVMSPPEFCTGMGSGACLPYVECTMGCGTCAAPIRRGDQCGSDVPILVVARRGRTRAAFSNCGLRDDINLACPRPGADLAVAVRLETGGRVTFTYSTPRGVTVLAAYDSFRPDQCRGESPGRVCVDNASETNVRTSTATLNPGTYYLYLGATQPSTIVVDVDVQ